MMTMTAHEEKAGDGFEVIGDLIARLHAEHAAYSFLFDAAERLGKQSAHIAALEAKVARFEEARFLPMGDNHHNAMKCPYCNPDRIDFGALKARAADLEAALARSGLIAVEKVECVSYETGFKQPAEPIWRVAVDGYCADFETETAASNFASAINSRAADLEAKLAEHEKALGKALERHLELEAALAAARAESRDMEDVLRGAGFRRCDIAACNCNSWHQVGGFKARFVEIEEVVEDAGFHTNGRTLLNAVKAAVAELTTAREQIAAKDAALLAFSRRVPNSAKKQPRDTIVAKSGIELGMFLDADAALSLSEGGAK